MSLFPNVKTSDYNTLLEVATKVNSNYHFVYVIFKKPTHIAYIPYKTLYATALLDFLHEVCFVRRHSSQTSNFQCCVHSIDFKSIPSCVISQRGLKRREKIGNTFHKPKAHKNNICSLFYEKFQYLVNLKYFLPHLTKSVNILYTFVNCIINFLFCSKTSNSKPKKKNYKTTEKHPDNRQ